MVQFGEIDIDSELVAYKENVEGDQFIMMLNNGCLCCTVKDDLLDMLEELVLYPVLPVAPPACNATLKFELVLLMSVKLALLKGTFVCATCRCAVVTSLIMS